MCVVSSSLFLGNGPWANQNLLRAPRRYLGRVQLVRVAAVEPVHRLELTGLLTCAPEAADDRAVELHLVDLARLIPRSRRVRVRIRVRHEEVLVRPGRDTHLP